MVNYSGSYRTYFNWSSGKDSALALYYLLNNPEFKVEYLLTSINASVDRVSMHGVRRELLEQQIASIGIPGISVELPEEPDMAVYERKMTEALDTLVAKGITHAAFGDIFLEDLRTYREDQLKKRSVTAQFPLWKKDTRALMEEFNSLGFKTVVVCVNSQFLDESFVGRILDQQFLDDLPANVDPCGENGEFHTFCFDGPIFKKPIQFTVGEKVFRSYQNPNAEDDLCGKSLGFWFCDLLPAVQ